MKKIISLSACLLIWFSFLLSSFSPHTNIGKPVSASQSNMSPTPAVYYFSPIPAIGVGPNGLPTKKIIVEPYCCPSEAIEVKAIDSVRVGDFQRVLIPLALPGGSIQTVRICYSTTNGAFISQTSLTSMDIPNKANVVYNDAIHRSSLTPTCYQFQPNIWVKATITLSVFVVIPAGGSIIIGAIYVSMK